MTLIQQIIPIQISRQWTCSKMTKQIEGRALLCIRSYSLAFGYKTPLDRSYRKNREVGKSGGRTKRQKRRRNKFAHARRGGNWPAIFARLTDNCRRNCFSPCFIPSLCTSSPHFLRVVSLAVLFFLLSLSLFFSLSFLLAGLPASRNAVSSCSSCCLFGSVLLPRLV